MKIYQVTDPEFSPYGRIIPGFTEQVKEIYHILEHTPLTDGVVYVPLDERIQNSAAAKQLSVNLFGGMPAQFGWCNGRNSKLNCLEYHRNSEFNLGSEDFILLLARQKEIQDGQLDTAKVKAFAVPAGVLIEVFATSLHYAPCHVNQENGFRVLVALPLGTNTTKPATQELGGDDGLLWARNKWLLAHPESPEAALGAYVGLSGSNLDLSAK